MDEPARQILIDLQRVSDERRQRAAVPGLSQRVQALKAYQQARFRRTYADLLAAPRYREAALFFLHELYGPGDFTRRDDQFARIVGPMVRLFPAGIVATVQDLAALHALSEQLDTAMAAQLPDDALDAAAYTRAWQAVGRAGDRDRQIQLLLHVGQSLDRFTRSAVLRHGLRAMRSPARAAGLSELQAFLEAGFDTFRAMGGAQEFLTLVRQREQRLCQALFHPEAVARVTGAPLVTPDATEPLGQLP